MKKFCLVFLSAVTAVVASAQTSPLITKPLAEGTVSTVLSETSGGNILVTGVTGSFKAELYAVANNSKDKKLSEQELRDRLEKEYDVKMEVEGNKLIATAKPKTRNMNWKKGLSISFKIYVPKNVSTDISTSGGNIELYHVTGTQDFTTSGGNLIVTDVAGKINGTTSGGNIIIENAHEEINLTTSGGNIEAKQCDGKIKLITSGGNVEMTALKGNIKATTSGGNVSGETIEGDLNASTSGGNIELTSLSCNVVAATSGGDISVAITKLMNNVRLSNSGGNIKLNIPDNSAVDLNLYAEKIKTDQLKNFSGKFEDDKVEGKLNGGGATVTVKADGGTIYLGLK
ncbi:MAG TPA: DUF4097 family beta strand repeat-containing protein [Ferruginibacter sp.]|nr:DUF4097 family beta strand repeat-containing protein [Ferruginibacter sp.]